MRNILFLLFPFLLMSALLTGSGCKKEHATSTSSEADLRISTDAAALSYSPASNFNFMVTVESVMPEKGIRVVYEVYGEADNQAYPQGPVVESTSKATPISLTNLPRQKICVCIVTVTSKTKSTNTVSTNFRVVFK